MTEPDAAIVTGSWLGIDRVVATHLATQGMRVVVNDIGARLGEQSSDPSVAAAVADEIREAGGEAIWNSQGPPGPAGVREQPVRRVFPRCRQHPVPPSRRPAASDLQAHAEDGRDVMAVKAHGPFGPGAEIVRAVMATDAFWCRDEPPVVIALPAVPAPYAPVLEQGWFPVTDRIAADLRAMLTGSLAPTTRTT